MHPCLIGFTLVARLAPHPSTMEVADRRTCPIDCAKKKKETNTRAIFCSIYIFLNLGSHSVPCFMDRWHHWHSLPWGPALSHAVALTRAHVKRLTILATGQLTERPTKPSLSRLTWLSLTSH